MVSRAAIHLSFERSTMSVSLPCLTSSVIVSLVCISTTTTTVDAADWSYPVKPPVAPKISRHRELKNPSVAQIQNAIRPHTSIQITGNVDGSGGKTIKIDADDVQLDFSHASLVT